MLLLFGLHLLACPSRPHDESPTEATQRTEWLKALAREDHLSAMAPPLDDAVLDRVKRSVVLLATPLASGSGVIVGTEPDWLLVATNAHVTGPFLKLNAYLSPGTGFGRESPAEVVHVAPELDLAILRIPRLEKTKRSIGSVNDGETTAGIRPLFLVLETAEVSRGLALAPYTDLGPMTPLYTAGFPFGFRSVFGGGFPAVTIGPGLSLGSRQAGSSPLQLFLGGVNPGNSGGAVVDAEGRLRGIVTAHVPSTEWSHLVPAEHLWALLKRVESSAQVEWTPGPVTRHLPLAPRAMAARDVASLLLVRSSAGEAAGVAIGSNGGALLVVTSAPVGGWEGSRVEVRGQRGVSTAATVVFTDQQEGLALLRVDAMAGVVPLHTNSRLPSVRETQGVQAMLISDQGVVTTTTGSISALWETRDSVRAAKLDLGINGTALGGLVFDTTGEPLGVALISLSGTNVTTLIPTDRIHEMAKGHLAAAQVSAVHDGFDTCAIQVQAEFADPLRVLQRAGLSVSRSVEFQRTGQRQDVTDMGFALQSAPIDASGTVALDARLSPCRPGPLSVQVWWEGPSGRVNAPPRVLTAGPTLARIVFRGPFFSGDRPVDFGPPPQVTFAEQPCARGAGRECMASCDSGSPEACLTIGDTLLRIRPILLAADVEAAVSFFGKACALGLPRGCAQARELDREFRPDGPTTALVETARARCARGLLVDCLLVETQPWNPGRAPPDKTRLRQVCEAGLDEACAAWGEAFPDQAGPALLFGCTFGGARSCLALAALRTASELARGRAARDACDLGLPSACASVESGTDPERALPSGVTPAEGMEAVLRSGLRPTGITPRVDAHGTRSWAVVDTENVTVSNKRTVGEVQVIVEHADKLVPPSLANLEGSAANAARCLLVQLSYDDTWMKLPLGSSRDLEFRVNEVGAVPVAGQVKWPRGGSCGHVAFSRGVRAASPIRVRLRVLR